MLGLGGIQYQVRGHRGTLSTLWVEEMAAYECWVGVGRVLPTTLIRAMEGRVDILRKLQFIVYIKYFPTS